MKIYDLRSCDCIIPKNDTQLNLIVLEKVSISILTYILTYAIDAGLKNATYGILFATYLPVHKIQTFLLFSIHF